MDLEAMKTMSRQQLEELMRRYPPQSSEGVQVREEWRRRMQRWGQVAGAAWTAMLLCALLIALVTWLH
jgi:hypothetical protein